MVSARHVDIYHFIHACQQSHAPRKEAGVSISSEN